MKKAARYLLGLGIISAAAVTILNRAKEDDMEVIGIDDLDEYEELDEDGEDECDDEDEITIELFEMEPANDQQ